MEPPPVDGSDGSDGEGNQDAPAQRILKLWTVGSLMTARALRTPGLMQGLSACIRTQAQVVESRVLTEAVVSAMRAAATAMENEDFMEHVSDAVAHTAHFASTEDATKAAEGAYTRGCAALTAVLDDSGMRRRVSEALDLVVFVAENAAVRRLAESSCMMADTACRAALQSGLVGATMQTGSAIAMAASQSRYIWRTAEISSQLVGRVVTCVPMKCAATAAGKAIKSAAGSRAVRMVGNSSMALVDRLVEAGKQAEEEAAEVLEREELRGVIAEGVSVRSGCKVSAGEMCEWVEVSPRVRDALVDECVHQLQKRREAEQRVVELEEQMQRPWGVIMSWAQTGRSLGRFDQSGERLRDQMWGFLTALWMIGLAGLLCVVTFGSVCYKRANSRGAEGPEAAAGKESHKDRERDAKTSSEFS
eukprot:TRINITY_DN9337_c0_g1_i1.p1 TRINITY_DN9337_c0_g1~~TRINITY_DN9337_c0_g1_i1.p1  ORF type:complete len:419 (+),score=94.12 TRINITY_DN9337_c0_g1_i1:198-1454(+)